MPLLTGTGDIDLTDIEDQIAVLETTVSGHTTSIATNASDLDDLEAVLLPTVDETQLRAPAAGKVTIETSAGTAFATFDASDSSVSTTGALTVGGTLSLGATNVNTTLTAHGSRLTGLETLVVGSSTETQIRAPVDGKVTIETSAAQPVGPSTPFATFDATDSSVTLTGPLTVGSTDVGASLGTLNDRLVISGTNTYFKSIGGFVGFADDGGARTLWMDEVNRQVVSDYGAQYRDSFLTYTDAGAGLRLMLGAFAPTGNIIFRDPATNGNYLTTDAANKTVTVPTGSTLQVDGTTTLNGTTTVEGAMTVNSAGSLNMTGPLNVNGTMTVGPAGNLVATGTTCTLGTVSINNLTDFAHDTFNWSPVYGTGAVRSVNLHGVTYEAHEINETYGKVFTAIPSVVVTPESANPFLGRLQNCFVRNRSTTGFTVGVWIAGAVGTLTINWIATAL
jgi:hypothetical protein